jgi:UDP-N-acetylglucosamine acyltransferase
MKIHPAAIVHENVIIEDKTDTYIGPFSVIGGPPEHRDFWNREYGSVVIGKNVRISNLVTVDAGTTGTTFINQGCVLLAHSHVGHDAVLGDDVVLSCGVKVGGHCFIGAGTIIGLNATIHQNVNVPEGCMIGMNAVVTKSMKLFPFSMYAGNPAKYIKPNLVAIKKEAAKMYPSNFIALTDCDANKRFRRAYEDQLFHEAERLNRGYSL